MKQKIAVLGAGTMGAGMAATYALYGYPVSLYSRTEDTLHRAKETIQNALETMVHEDMTDEKAAKQATERIVYTTELKNAVRDAWYIAETIAEKKSAKTELYQTLDVMVPDNVIFASNTSYMNIFEFISESRQKDCVIAHWVAPPHIIPLVEVVRGPKTSEEVMNQTIELHETCGKTPVRMERYVPGFVLNRLQSAMTREVMYLIDGGLCTAEDIDKVVKTSLMPRGMLLGVVERMDFTGLQTVANGLKNGSYQPAPPVCEDSQIFRLVEEGNLGAKTGKGFYDYGGNNLTGVLEKRDQQLIQSMRLAQQFLKDPLYEGKSGKP